MKLLCEVAESLDIYAVTFNKCPDVCQSLFNLAAKKFNRLNAIYAEKKMQLEEHLGKDDSIPCTTTGIRQIYNLTSHLMFV